MNDVVMLVFCAFRVMIYRTREANAVNSQNSKVDPSTITTVVRWLVTVTLQFRQNLVRWTFVMRDTGLK